MKLLLIGGFAESIPAFRGDLIRDLQSAGCEVHVAAPDVSKLVGLGDSLGLDPDRLHDVPIRRTGTNPFSDLKLLFALFQLMRKLNPDVMLAYTIKPVIYGVLAARLAGVSRRFALITGLGYAFTGTRRGVTTRIASFLYRLALGCASKVFFQNRDDEQLFRELNIVSASTQSVVINGSGVNVATHYFTPLPGEQLVFLMIGRLLGDKGVREYAQAAGRIRREHPAVAFHLIGWIDSNPDAISQGELDDWVASGALIFLGRLDDVRPAIAQSAVYVLPSYREGTPRTVLEAMAMGRAIITTDAPGCRETVVDGDNGFLVPVRSVDALVAAMRAFIHDPSLLTRMGIRSRQIAEEKYDVRKVNAVMLQEMGIAPALKTGKEN